MTFDPNEKSTHVHWQNALFQFKLKVSTLFSSGDKKSQSLRPEMTPVILFDLWLIKGAQLAYKLSRRFIYLSYMTIKRIMKEK